MAKIDILLPVKNGRVFLAEAIDSIRAQTITDWRLLVLDHGSTDGSIEIAEAFEARDPRVELHSLPQAEGLSGLLNCGLDMADCEYVMRHDADDICLPDRMAVTLAAFAAQPDCTAVSGQADVIDGTGTKIDNLRLPIGAAGVSAATLFRNPISHPASMLRFDHVHKMGVRYGIDILKALPEHQRMKVPALAEDYFLFGQLGVLGKASNVPQKLIRYRWHANNVSVTRFTEQMELSLAISRSLARSFCTVHGLPWFDPAPFCNHGAILYDVDGQMNFDAEFEKMAAALRFGFGPSPELERELGYRRAISNRNKIAMLWRYSRFRSAHAPETNEWNAVRGWMVRSLPGKRRITVAPELL